MLLQQSKDRVSIEYTCNTYIEMQLVYVIYSVVLGQNSYTLIG